MRMMKTANARKLTKPIKMVCNMVDYFLKKSIANHFFIINNSNFRTSLGFLQTLAIYVPVTEKPWGWWSTTHSNI